MKTINIFLSLIIYLSVSSNLVFAQETSYTYTNQEQDKSGLIHYDSRYYDPELGRFLQPDSLDVPNKYSYVSNDPVNYTDPTGHEPYPLPENLQSLYGGYPLLGPMSYDIQSAATEFIASSWSGLSQTDFSFFGNAIGKDNLIETIFMNPSGLGLNDSTRNSYSDFRQMVSDHMMRELRGPNARRIPGKENIIKAIVENYTILKHIGPAAGNFSLNLVGGTDYSMYPTFTNGDILLTEQFIPDSSLPNFGLEKDGIVRAKINPFDPEVVKRVHDFQKLGKDFMVILYTDNKVLNTPSVFDPQNKQYHATVKVNDITGVMRLLFRDGQWQTLPPKPY